MNTTVSHKSLFLKLRDEAIILRHRMFSYWTLPYLHTDPRETSTNGRAIVHRDFQEIGALLVNNLAAKLARLLFPTQYSFFKASPSKAMTKALKESGQSDNQINTAFAQLETQAKDRLFVNAGYASLILALKHLIVSGQVLLYRDPDDACMTAWGTESFAVRRDGTGKLLDCVLREYTSVEALPEGLQNALRISNRSKYSRPEQAVEKYTRIHRVTKNNVVGHEVSQEVDNISVGAASWYPEMLCPFQVPIWTLIPGEHYARGLVEDFAGGFARLSSLSEASALYGVEMCRVIHMVGPGSNSDIDELNNAESGEFVRGDAGQIQAYEAGDAAKLQQLRNEITDTYQRLSRAFMYTGVARQAERVTAYELQQEALEAENTLGGTISTLAAVMQMPLAYQLMTEVHDDALTGLVTGHLKPDVTTGIPALGRSGDVQNLLQAAQEIAAIAPIVQVDKRLNPQSIVDVILAGRSIDPATVMYTPEQQKKNAEADAAAQQAQLAMAQGQLASSQGAAAQSGAINQTLGA